MKFDNMGREIPDPTPVEIPAEFQRPESMDDKIRRMISGYMSVQAVAEGRESFEDANDFEIPDEDEFQSPYEFNEMQEEAPRERVEQRRVSDSVAASPVRGSDSGGRDVERAGTQRPAGGASSKAVRSDREDRHRKERADDEGKRGPNRGGSRSSKRSVQRDIEDGHDA